MTGANRIAAMQSMLQYKFSPGFDKLEEELRAFEGRRQVSTMQAAQHHMQHDKVVDVSAFMLDIDPRCHSAIGKDDSDQLNEAADEVQLEHENEKKRLPKRTETVFKESTEGSDLKQFELLVLPSSRSCLQRKTI